MVKAVRTAAAAAGRDPDEVRICVAAPAYLTDGSEQGRAHALQECRWFGGMVGNHVADLVARYGEGTGIVPTELTDYVKGRRSYDYGQHGRVGNSTAAFVPDEIVERFCLIGPPEEHIEKLSQLQSLGVDQFALYAMHDAVDEVIDGYGKDILTRFAQPAPAPRSARTGTSASANPAGGGSPRGGRRSR
jgi:alkanesulfonate monooxygenase SsuD/methylene tetrahydromethanopterin reductase-like flavin-dependent oxidoreductase (luciferase family)